MVEKVGKWKILDSYKRENENLYVRFTEPGQWQSVGTYDKPELEFYTGEII